MRDTCIWCKKSFSLYFDNSVEHGAAQKNVILLDIIDDDERALPFVFD